MRASPDAEQFELVTVQSGARSLRSREFGETFHPVVGPMAEAEALHVRQQRLVARAGAMAEPLVIWDVGLGAAANAVAVLEAFAASAGGRADLHSFDQTTAPLVFALAHAAELGYLAPHSGAIEQLLRAGFWETPQLRWHFHSGDFRTTMNAAPAPHAILYDPYSPVANPQLWSLEHFTDLRERLDPARPCLLTNYTRSTSVRVTLLLAGFRVGYGHATGEKDQTTIASNDPRLLENPLGAGWLGTVRRSTHAAPRRGSGETGRISAADFDRLVAHPQFAALRGKSDLG